MLCKNKTKKDIHLTIFGVASFLLALCAYLGSLIDTDFWWHSKFGEIILTLKKVPSEDVFSWYGKANNLEIFPQEWLSQVLLYLVDNFFGIVGVSLFTAFLGAVLLFSIYYFNRKNFLNCGVSIVAFLLLFMCIFLYAYVSPRPQMFSFLFVSYLLYVLSSYKDSEKDLLWTLPILSILWINFHGGTAVLLFILLISNIFLGFFSFETDRVFLKKINKKKNLKIFYMLLLSLCTSLLNPVGYKMLLYPLENITDKTMLTNISEWSPLTINSFVGFFFFLILLVIILVLIFTKTKIDFYDLFLIMIFTFLALKIGRFGIYFAIIVFPLIAKYINTTKKIHALNKSITDNLNYIAPLFLLLSLMTFFTCLTDIIKTPVDYSKIVTNEVIDVIKKESPQRLLNFYDYGGYLIYNDIDVFLDGRYDLYADNIIKDFIDLNSPLKAESILKKHDFDLIVYPIGTDLVTILELNDDYEEIYINEKDIIFKKK